MYRGKNSREVYLASLLYDAIDDNNFSAVKLLLCEKEADPNFILPLKNISSFHLAVGCEDEIFALNVTKLILQNGGNPNVCSDDGLTPVHIAAAWGRVEILRILLNCGGDCQYRDSNLMTPIHYAIKERCQDCVDLLRTYLPDNCDIINGEKENCCQYKLNKIIVNNGYASGEYGVCLQLENSVNVGEIVENLAFLPKPDTTNYVLDWFETHVDSKGGKTFLRNDTSDENPSDESSTKSYKNKIHEINDTNTAMSSSFNSAESDVREISSESGILSFTTSTDTNLNSFRKIVNGSSEYLTCSISSNLNKNILAITGESNLFTSDESCIDNNKINYDNTGNTELSFVTVSEFYKYEDRSEGIILYEKRMVKISSDGGESVKTFSTKMSSLPETFDYDAVTLRKELTLLGYHPPGPITITTKRLYLKKLYKLQKDAVKKSPQKIVKKTQQSVLKRVYSPELEKTLKDPTWKQDLSPYRRLEEVLLKEFSTPLPSRKWREGHSKSSFTYLLLDPRKTDDLPCRAHMIDPQEVWKTFLSAIFYIGKGKKTRPYSHLYEAVNLWRRGNGTTPKKKLQTILDIWKSNNGVICLHVFQNIIPVEAYTREATMISALKMENLTNEKQGEYYGTASTWQGTQKRLLGTYLLYKALTVFLTEGERQLYATDITTA